MPSLRRCLVLALPWLATACALPSPEAGAPVAGAVKVARVALQARARHTDLVDVTVLFPADSQGHPLHPGVKAKALVFVPGGFVPVARYEWLGVALAERGYVVALARQAGDLAFFSEENGSVARELLVHPPAGSVLEGLVDEAHIAVGGHSLGGVVAVKNALGGGFAALLLFASYPDSADDSRLVALGMPSLSLAGEKDCDAALATVSKAWNQLPAPSVLAVLAGMTHYQFTDSQAEDERAKCVAGISLSTAHERVVAAVSTFLEAAFAPVPGTGADLMRAQPGVLSVEAR